MANYLLKYKGKYRILPTLDESTNDFPRHIDDSIEDIDIYISCQYGNKIFCYGHDNGSRMVWLEAYIPSLGRGKNIIKSLDEIGIEYKDYIETDSEVIFKFKSKDIDTVADLMKAKVSGANISPFSTRNFPKTKFEIPLDEIKRYKEIVSIVNKNDLLIIHKTTSEFLNTVLQNSIKKSDKKFNYKSDIRKMCMGRQNKEYIYVKGFWEEYLIFLKNKINDFYSNNAK